MHEPRDLAAMRQRYETDVLADHCLPADPLAALANWLADATAAGAREPNAMTLATVGVDGAPAARVVLCKGIDALGLRFFTNYQSDKAAELRADGRAAVTFFWETLARQVRVSGQVVPLTRSENERYFAQRPRESQLGAWASPQSQPVADRATLDRFAAEVEARFAGTDVACPEHWGGYQLMAQRVELWAGQPGRMHDRVRYERTAAGWAHQRLAP